MADRQAPDVLSLHLRIAELQEEVARRRDGEERERQARDLAEAANRAKDVFLIQLSHELRAPLHAIVGWAHLLRMAAGDPERVRTGVEAIERNARIQTRLIDDVLNASRLGAGTMPLSLQPVYLAPLVVHAVDDVRPLAAERGIDLLVESDPHGGTVRGDPERLQQIMGSVLSNAVKFTLPGGRIEVSLSRDDVRAEIRVVDTGIGFDPGTGDEMFESSHQPGGDDVGPHGGFGHGLGVARHLTELQGGTLDAASPGPGQGATVTLRFPLLPLVLEEPAVAATQAEPIQPCDGLRILVVDDEDDARSLVAEVLAHHGAAVDVARSALLAMAALSKVRYDVLVSDLTMPLDDGFSLIQQVRTEEGPNQHVPAIALTGHASEDIRDRALGAGFAAYVTKPVAPTALVNVIAAVAGGTPHT